MQLDWNRLFITCAEEIAMSEPIKPALTPEEWEHLEFAIASEPGKPGHTLFGYLKPETSNLHVGWNGDPMHAVTNTAPLAALALYGRPFGFTQEDVRRCRDVADGIEREFANGRTFEAFGTAAFIEEWRRLADRIEALLRPRP